MSSTAAVPGATNGQAAETAPAEKPSLIGAAIRGLFGSSDGDETAKVDAAARPDDLTIPATPTNNPAGIPTFTTPEHQAGQQAAADPNSPEYVVQKFIEGTKSNDAASMEELISSSASGQLRVIRKGELKESVRERLQNSLDGVKVLGSKPMKGNKKAVVIQNGFGRTGNFIIGQEGDKPVILEMNLPR